MIFSILQNQMLITFDFGGASLCHEILHFVQKSQIGEFIMEWWLIIAFSIFMVGLGIITVEAIRH